MRPTQARIHLDAIRANLAEVRRVAGVDVIGVVKADAYGHGAPAVAGALAEAGCRQLAVLSVEEGQALRKADRPEAILVLGGVHDAEEAALAAFLGLVPVVHHRGHLELLAGVAEASQPLPVHVEVDTGMSRMGVAEGEALDLLVALNGEPSLRLAGVYTHLCAADEADLAPSRDQLRRFGELLERLCQRGIDPGLVHFANSAAALVGADLASAGPAPGAVRVGLALYGAQPSAVRTAALRPAMSLVTQVVHVRRLEPGTSVGYGRSWLAPGETRVATLAVGYADGIPRAAGNRAEVAIRGRRFPVVGRISMDFTNVDVGDAPVEPGDEAWIFGAGPAAPPVEALAEAAGTLAYEILVGVGSRVPRVIDEG